MNYMREVAQMLGVELGEEFELKKGIGDIYRYKLTSDGLVTFSPNSERWYEGNKLLVDLLLGKDEVWETHKPILNEKEKEYLSNVIKPFRDTVKRIVKVYDFGKEFISIDLERGEIQLPYFEPDTMYKGMEIYKDYTLEELGL